MPHTSESILVHASPAAVFETVVDFPSYTQWVREMKNVDVLERDDQGRAIVVSYRAAAFGRSTTYVLRYDYSAAPEILRWSQENADLTSRLEGNYRFDAEGGATRVTYNLDVELAVPLPSFVKSRATQRIIADALEDLQRRVERA
jgi:ribosome-associated toxin RatA of RatAB toxin-antitoxin module